jgi:hypothetical protein
MRPQPNVLNAPMGDKTQVFAHAIESLGVSSLPDVPGDSGDDCCFFKIPASHGPEVGEVGGSPSAGVWKEEGPDFPSTGAEQQHVVSVFILGAGEVGSSGTETMAKPAFIC